MIKQSKPLTDEPISYIVCTDHGFMNVRFFPNWVGVDQVRFVTLEGDRLTLMGTTDPSFAPH